MSARKLQAAALAATLAFAVQVRCAELPLPKDGWASWDVEAVDDAPAMCCWGNWTNGVAQPQSCNLDGDKHGYGTQGHETTSTMRIYAKFANGKLEKLRPLAASCPVETKTPIQKLDDIATDDSARWLIGITHQPGVIGKSRQDDGEEVILALAAHRGDVAFDGLANLARNDANEEGRKQAIFWIADMRGVQGADLVANIMFADKSSEVRKHSIFALTLSKSPRIAADITKAGNTDKDGDVRAQAWFWLAQTHAPGAEAALVAAAKNDADDHVREQAIFAMSQLPDERSTKALIMAAEDKSLDREQRKRAVFWLGQSGKPGAQEYLDKVLLGSTR
jgi:hypothetical protein